MAYHNISFMHHTCVSKPSDPPIKEKLLSPKVQHPWHPPKSNIAFQTSTLLGPFPSKEDQDTLKHILLEAQFPLETFFTYINLASHFMHQFALIHYASANVSTQNISCNRKKPAYIA
jgi:hypothetical protein